MAFGEFSLRDTAGSPERARWLHLARSGSQSQRAIWVILLTRGASRICLLLRRFYSEAGEAGELEAREVWERGSSRIIINNYSPKWR